jgi:tRNA G18 (ribose-2'-O)-methylase SpoU
MERLVKIGAVEGFEDWNVAVAASVMRYSPHTSEGR